jgi:sulfate transport system substrate-binding protein
VWSRVVAQAASARAARTQFENGFGDALVTYEQDVLKDKARGRLKGEIVYPRSTVLSEHTLVRIDRNVPEKDRALVDAFVEYLWTDEAQDEFSRYGFRSVRSERNEGFMKIEDPFLVSDFGGWKKVKAEIVEGVWKKTVLKELGK